MTEPPVLAPEQVPPFVKSAADLYRWRLCIGVAQQISGTNDLMLARLMYDDPSIPTQDPEVQEATGDELTPAEHAERVLAGKASAAKRKAERDAREGLKPMEGAPEPKMTAEEMAERGYDRTPEKGEKAQELLGDHFDTHMLHRPEGDLSHLPAEMRYTPERMKDVHDPVVHALTDPHASQDEPHVLIVAGGPASGKSTFLKRAQGALPIPSDPVSLNADDIAFGEGPHHGIPEAADMLDDRDPYAALGSHREAGDIFEKAERAAIGKRANLVMDVTGNSDLRDFEHQLERLRDNGYKVDLLYVSTPTETAVHNNIHRAETEGRYVPTPIVRDKHRRVAENYQSVSQLPWLNSVRVYDPEVGLAGFRNERGVMEPTHEEAYARWMSKAQEEPPESLPSTRRRVEEAADKPPVIMYPFELQDREKAHAEFDKLAAEQARRGKK